MVSNEAFSDHLSTISAGQMSLLPLVLLKVISLLRCKVSLVVHYRYFLCVLYVQQQDHYAVLGLAKLRYRASDDQIKRACEWRAIIGYLRLMQLMFVLPSILYIKCLIINSWITDKLMLSFVMEYPSCCYSKMHTAATWHFPGPCLWSRSWLDIVNWLPYCASTSCNLQMIIFPEFFVHSH